MHAPTRMQMNAIYTILYLKWMLQPLTHVCTYMRTCVIKLLLSLDGLWIWGLFLLKVYLSFIQFAKAVCTTLKWHLMEVCFIFGLLVDFLPSVTKFLPAITTTTHTHTQHCYVYILIYLFTFIIVHWLWTQYIMYMYVHMYVHNISPDLRVLSPGLTRQSPLSALRTLTCTRGSVGHSVPKGMSESQRGEHVKSLLQVCVCACIGLCVYCVWLLDSCVNLHISCVYAVVLVSCITL